MTDEEPRVVDDTETVTVEKRDLVRWALRLFSSHQARLEVSAEMLQAAGVEVLKES